MSTEYDGNVIFNAGAPIDKDQLNKLQSNISYIKSNTESQLSNATVTINDVTTRVKVVPVIYTDTVKITMNTSNNRGYKSVDFGSTFDRAGLPVRMVASISSNVVATDGFTLRATVNGNTSGEIEVYSLPNSKVTEVLVTYIAVQLKQVS